MSCSPQPNRQFPVHEHLHCRAERRRHSSGKHRQQLRFVPAGPGDAVQDRCPIGVPETTRDDRRVLSSGRLAGYAAAHAQSRRSLHPQLPVHRRGRSRRRLQPANAEARLFRPERLSPQRAQSGERQLRTARRRRLQTHGFVCQSRSGYSLTWIEQAGITTPFTTPLFPFIQTLGQQTWTTSIRLSSSHKVRPSCRSRPDRMPASARVFSASSATTAAGMHSSGI